MTDIVTADLPFIQLTDPETGLPVIVRSDLIIAVYPMQRVPHPPSVVVIDGCDLHLVVTESPSTVWETILQAQP